MKLLNAIFLSTSLILLVSCQEENDPVKSNSINFVQGVINDEFLGKSIVIYAEGINNTLVAFNRNISSESTLLEFILSDSPSPAVLQDQFGNDYDIHGNQIVDGDATNKSLKSVDHIVGYWFFFSSMYQEIFLNSGQNIINPQFDNSSEDWLINTDYVFTGASRDGIPSIDEPKFLPVDGKLFIDNEFYSTLDPNELVTVVRQNDETHIFPHRILEYHEVVNDIIGGTAISVSYCPLTGTSSAWNRKVKGETVEFGVSGLLYNNNLIMYDRTSESYWSQILDVSIFGSCISNKAGIVDVFETSLRNASRLDGNIYLLSTETGYKYNYNQSIYDDYKSTNGVSFPLSNKNESMEAKERVLGIVSGSKVKVYSFKDFED